MPSLGLKTMATPCELEYDTAPRSKSWRTGEICMGEWNPFTREKEKVTGKGPSLGIESKGIRAVRVVPSV